MLPLSWAFATLCCSLKFKGKFKVLAYVLFWSNVWEGLMMLVSYKFFYSALYCTSLMLQWTLMHVHCVSVFFRCQCGNVVIRLVNSTLILLTDKSMKKKSEVSNALLQMMFNKNRNTLLDNIQENFGKKSLYNLKGIDIFKKKLDSGWRC